MSSVTRAYSSSGSTSIDQRAVRDFFPVNAMRHVAMNENKKIAEVARSIITAAELLR